MKKLLSEKRKGEIAIALVKHLLLENQINLDPNHVSRRIGNVAKATGIPADELKEFARSIMKELVENAFGK